MNCTKCKRETFETFDTLCFECATEAKLWRQENEYLEMNKKEEIIDFIQEKLGPYMRYLHEGGKKVSGGEEWKWQEFKRCLKALNYLKENLK